MVFPGVTARFSSPRLNMLPSILLGALDVSNESFESRSGGRGSRERCMYVCKAYEDRGYASGVRCARDLGIAGSRGFRQNRTCPRAFRIPGSPRFGTFEVSNGISFVSKTGKNTCSHPSHATHDATPRAKRTRSIRRTHGVISRGRAVAGAGARAYTPASGLSSTF